jgi:hypothetical protein
LRVNISPSGATITSIALLASPLLCLSLAFVAGQHTISNLLQGAHFAFSLTIRRAKRASVISPICFFWADPQIVSTYANAASIFPYDSALRSARLPAAHHLENVTRRALRF